MFYDVERIIGKRIVNGKIWYRVKWEGYPHSECTWQPPYTLQSIRQLIEEFEQERFGNKVSSIIFEDHNYGITDDDFVRDKKGVKKGKKIKKSKKKQLMSVPCVQGTIAKKAVKQESSSTQNVKVEAFADEDQYNQTSEFPEPISSAEAPIYCLPNCIKILCFKPCKKNAGTLIYLVELGTKQIVEMTGDELIKVHPCEFAEYLQEVLRQKILST